MKNPDFLIVGAGIFGVCTSLALSKRGYSVTLINPDQIPHPLAASTDISKVIRMEYGSDLEYMDMAIKSMEQWRSWNDQFNDCLFHEVGYLLTAAKRLEDPEQLYEFTSYRNLLSKGYEPVRLQGKELIERFPAFAPNQYVDGFYHAVGGYAESGRAVEVLARYAQSLGVRLCVGQTAGQLIVKDGKAQGVFTREGQTFVAGHVIICAGNFTPYLLPELKPFMKVTGHPVFHIKPSQPFLFRHSQFSVFAADISRSGWYGFPLHPTKGVVKVARHSNGLELHPEQDERKVYQSDLAALKEFLSQSLPPLQDDPIVYTRRCCYTDTLDGHFWIDRHPDIKNLTVGSGGSGHGFKMGPEVGKMIADTAEGKAHSYSDRYSWRNLNQKTEQSEEARYLPKRTLS